jgi:predicted transposase/invertase (TIGR01784 family)
MYKVPKLSREEIKTMLQIHDIRESRAYQEAKEEGVKEGMEKGIEKGIEKAVAIAKLAAKMKSVEEIAAILAVDVELVRQVLTQIQRD